MKIQFNPEKIWLDRIEGQRKPGGCRVDLAGKHAIPTAQLTEQICLRIMETRTGNWRNELSDVPLHLRTPAVCLAAIKVLSSDASDIPREVWTPEFIERAFAVLPCGDHLLRYIPGELITADICRHCVETNGYALTDVPNHLKTDDLCLEAVRRNGSEIAFVPEAMLTERIIMAAFRQHPAALDWAPKEVMVTMPNVVTEWVRSDLNRIAEITNPEVFRKVAEALGLDVVSS
ncbi:MAG: DUF4116 domain-containing protein [Deltaproteobacteria bacterium]|nr:DUF4116 domain-containing protein [Deltaproteobacteria bacterium]